MEIGTHSLSVLERAREKAARIALVDPRALPVFERLEKEVVAMSAKLAAKTETDPVMRARALLMAERVCA
ncbi:hypothetical protein [Celeribacter ethanolicus]|uniref:hypothetical protein n=1 Tax=Celeribacter ethanolicus TaxID=1758178 RepID=UPI00082E8964|nr:hypothetical protein [Celeribacter ethanolicus]TNE64439.1 MAG: hypothetical protein EP336_15230 [Paracoccaceae bacterium]